MNSDAQTALSVSAVAELIRNLISQSISKIWIRGEVSNLKFQKNGNIYFSVKDDKSKLNALIMNFSKARKDADKLKDGMEILILGNVSYYTKEGYISVFVDALEFMGEGLLKQRFEELKIRLHKEGLFAQNLKKPIPAFPRVVGVITSPSGAAIQDILQVTGRRFSNVHIVIFPVAVQGDKAAYEISRGIALANKYGKDKIDVLIVGRGGGALEDLWCFNEEVVARAIFNSEIPVISAVGHEIDFTIADFVSDQRAPTPSAAAELVVRDKQETVRHLTNLKDRLEYNINNILEGIHFLLEKNGKDYFKKQLSARLSDLSLQTDNLTIRFQNQMSNYFKNLRYTIRLHTEKLSTLNPWNTLSRGYSVTFKEDSQGNRIPIKDCEGIQKGDTIHTVLHKGELESSITHIHKKNNSHK